jgi:hypothetical protein
MKARFRILPTKTILDKDRVRTIKKMKRLGLPDFGAIRFCAQSDNTFVYLAPMNYDAYMLTITA